MIKIIAKNMDIPISCPTDSGSPGQKLVSISPLKALKTLSPTYPPMKKNKMFTVFFNTLSPPLFY